MEAITQLVADSLARHGFDRPVDPRRLQWSRWFRCDSPHSLLVVPSKPGIFAIAEEVMDLGIGNAHVGTAVLGCPAERSSAVASSAPTALPGTGREGYDAREGHDFSRAVTAAKNSTASAAEIPTRRMLAVLKFSEDDDMAFTLDRMFTCVNPMRARLSSGRCFLRFVVIEDQAQRFSICTALNQWMLASTEKATGLPPDFASSLEMTNVARAPSPAAVVGASAVSHGDQPGPKVIPIRPAQHMDSGGAKNLHCPDPFPSGF